MEVVSQRPQEAPALAPVSIDDEGPRRRRPPRWAWGLALALVAGLAALGWQRRGAQEPAAAWTTASVEKRRIVARVSATGTLSALVTVQVGSQVSGRIQELAADFNSQVKKGQVIARIDP